MPKPSFRFKQFTIQQDRCALKVGTDAVLFGAWVDYAAASRILDIGTGTGVLALVAAQRNTTARIDAVEIDDASAEQAEENVAASPWADRVRVYRMDVRRMHASEPYDLILCNPPYYAGYSKSPDPRIGLAKHSGELLFPELLDAVDRMLAPQGRFAVIIPLNREKDLLQEAHRIGLSPARRSKPPQGLPRHEGTLLHEAVISDNLTRSQGPEDGDPAEVCIGLSPARRCTVRYVAHRPPKRVLLELVRCMSDRGPAMVEETELTVEATGPFDYTPEYRALIGDLMLNF